MLLLPLPPACTGLRALSVLFFSRPLLTDHHVLWLAHPHAFPLANEASVSPLPKHQYKREHHWSDACHLSCGEQVFERVDSWLQSIKRPPVGMLE